MPPAGFASFPTRTAQPLATGATVPLSHGNARRTARRPILASLPPSVRVPRKPASRPKPSARKVIEKAHARPLQRGRRPRRPKGTPTYPPRASARISPERAGWLIFPVLDKDGNVQSVQSVSPTGQKLFMPGGKMAGGRCWIGEPTEAGPLVLAEGYATAASIHEATGWPVCVTFTAGNLRRVACDVREQFPRAKLVIAGDDDRATEGNPGRTKALEAAKVVQGIAVFPSFASDQGSDWNDYAAAHGLEAVRRAITDAVEPPPVLWPADSGSIADYLDTPPPALHWFAHERLLANRAHLLTGMGARARRPRFITWALPQ